LFRGTICDNLVHGRPAASAEPRQPIAVHHKSKPSDLGMIGAFKFD
jgi:hypothetical protein